MLNSEETYSLIRYSMVMAGIRGKSSPNKNAVKDQPSYRMILGINGEKAG